MLGILRVPVDVAIDQGVRSGCMVLAFNVVGCRHSGHLVYPIRRGSQRGLWVSQGSQLDSFYNVPGGSPSGRASHLVSLIPPTVTYSLPRSADIRNEGKDARCGHDVSCGSGST